MLIIVVNGRHFGFVQQSQSGAQQSLLAIEPVLPCLSYICQAYRLSVSRAPSLNCTLQLSIAVIY